MFRFQHTEYLYFLAIVPLLVVLFTAMIYWRRKKMKKLGDDGPVAEQLRGYISGRSTSGKSLGGAPASFEYTSTSGTPAR